MARFGQTQREQRIAHRHGKRLAPPWPPAQHLHRLAGQEADFAQPTQMAGLEAVRRRVQVRHDGTSAVRQVGEQGGSHGGVFGRSKWDCKGFAGQSKDFIKGVSGTLVEFGYSGQRTDSIVNGITVSDVKWINARLGQISDRQIQDALEACGATASESSCYASAMRARLDRLKAVANGR